MYRIRFFCALAGLACAVPALAASSLSGRLNEKYLSALHRGALLLRSQAKPSDHSGELLDVRCVFHAHSRLSHDSPGTEAEIVAGAKAAKVRAVFMTEHPTGDRRWWTEGLRGVREGVLFVPGAELSDGLLLWRTDGTGWTPEMKAGDVLTRLQKSDAVAFVAHPEKRADAAWNLPPFAGMEIYNSHADAADSGYESLNDNLRGNPLAALGFVNTVKRYPAEAFASIFDEPAANLKRWDALNLELLSGDRRVVGIAGNDSHQNVGVTLEKGAGKIVAKDALGKVLGEVDEKQAPLFILGGFGKGGTLLRHTFDPYPVSMRYVTTHVLAPEVTEDALFSALRSGHAYVGFDWMADPSGFRFFAREPDRTVEMGSDADLAAHPTLTVRPNMACEIRLIRNAQEIQRTTGAELTWEAREPGVYRAEAWVSLGGETRPWVYTNPIYVK